MASQSQIIAEIESKVRTYSVWTIGVTDDPSRRRKEHGDPRNWYHWNVDSEQAARNVEKYFVDKGMRGAAGGGGRADYIYIFI